MNFISKEALRRIREEYPIGAKVELTKMNDPYRHRPRSWLQGHSSVRGRYGPPST